jgi:hypothetical protein
MNCMLDREFSKAKTVSASLIRLPLTQTSHPVLQRNVNRDRRISDVVAE